MAQRRAESVECSRRPDLFIVSSREVSPEHVPLSVRGLVKRFGDKAAVAGVSFDVAPGTIFCLMGPNGAGKTTTLEMSQGLRRPTEGTVRLFGQDPARAPPAIRRRMGVLPQRFACFPSLTVRENVLYFAALYGARPDVPALLRRLGLQDCERQRVDTLSGGTARRVGVATALVHDPDLLFLDEPTAGVDPASRREMWEVLLRLRDEGRSVVLTTHYMDEAERLSDDVAFIQSGRIVAQGPPERVRRQHGGQPALRLRGLDPRAALPDALAQRAGLAREPDGTLVVPLTHVGEAPLLLAELVKAGAAFREVSVREPTLDDAFLRLAGAAKGADA